MRETGRFRKTCMKVLDADQVAPVDDVVPVVPAGQVAPVDDVVPVVPAGDVGGRVMAAGRRKNGRFVKGSSAAKSAGRKGARAAKRRARK